MLGYLQGSTRPDIATAVHQCARFCNDHKLSHERAIIRIGKYLHGNKDKGISFRHDPTKGLECYADADFTGNWNHTDANNSDFFQELILCRCMLDDLFHGAANCRLKLPCLLLKQNTLLSVRI